MKKLVIFDFDGVIIDSWEHAYIGNMRSWPSLTPEQHRNFFNGNIHDELKKMPNPLYSYEDQQKWWDGVHVLKKSSLPSFDGVKEILEELVEKCVLSINTSSDSASTKNYLVENGLDFFDTIYGTETSKSKVEKFNKILEHYERRAEDCLFVTDTVGDVKEAQTLSIPTILVTWGYQNETHFDLMQEKVVGTVNSPRELLELIGE